MAHVINAGYVLVAVNNMSEHDSQIHEMLGYIRAKVEAIDKKLGEQNGNIVALQKTVSKHDIIFGKIGVGVTALLFVVAAGFNFIVDIIKTKLLK